MKAKKKMVVNDIKEKDKYISLGGKKVKLKKLEKRVNRSHKAFVIIFGNLLVIFLLLILLIGISS